MQVMHMQGNTVIRLLVTPSTGPRQESHAEDNQTHYLLARAFSTTSNIIWFHMPRSIAIVGLNVLPVVP